MTLIKSVCPLCGGPVKMKIDFRIGDQVACLSCLQKLEIIWCNPITLISSLEEDAEFIEHFYQ